MLGIIVSILVSIVSILPASPFILITSQIEEIEFLGFLNWFIPFDICCVMLEAWGIAMAAYLIYKVIRENLDKIL